MKQLTRPLTLTLVVLLLASGALALWLGTRSAPASVLPAVGDDGGYTVGTIPESGDGPVSAAAEAMPLALSYDYRTLDDGLKKATAVMTDDFAADFSSTFTRTAGQLATDKKAITRALVRGAGLVSQDGDKAVCLVYVDQVLVSSQAKDPKQPVDVTQNRVIVTLARDGDRWLVDGIKPF
jgi:hypothetical protein